MRQPKKGTQGRGMPNATKGNIKPNVVASNRKARPASPGLGKPAKKLASG